MRRKQPVTQQRRSEPRQQEPGSGQTTGQFSAFTAAEDRGEPQRPAPAVESAERPGGAKEAPQRGTTGRADFLSPLNWRVPTRLVAILVIPVVIALVFGGLRVNTSLDDYTQADRAVRIAKVASAATKLADALEQERDESLVPLLTGQGDQGEVKKLRDRTDQALADYRASFAKIKDDATVARRNAQFESMVESLPHLRKNAYSQELFATATANAYSMMFAPLLAMDNSVGFGSSNVTSKGRAIYAMSLAKASASTQRALMLHLLVGLGVGGVDGHEGQDLIQALMVANKLEQTARDEFNTASSGEEVKVYSDAEVAQATADQRLPLRMPDGHTMPTMSSLLMVGMSYAGQLATAASDRDAAARIINAAGTDGLTRPLWDQATKSHMSALRSAEGQLLDQVVADAQNIKDRAFTDWVLNSLIVIASLVLAGLLTGYIARSMILGMRTLNTAALDIANHRLPELVDKLSKTDPERVDTAVSPIPLWGKDEIGEVARAFDQVHQQAVSLAAEQALLRGNVNAIFTNLSRRSQGLIQRQLALITDLENNEADPDQLENLFKLDHLATRMRRNGENLLVLAGEEPGRRWSTPVPLVDVLRAAASEVEHYERIELAGIPEADVVGPAVTDLVHLLAELLENATSFSSPQTRVLVNATSLPDGRVLIEIHDKGIGLTAEDFAEINEKLAEPPTVDATISRRMGLFVVGRLSQRHDIRVQLRPSGESAGTTSLVMLPQQLTQLARIPEPQAEEFTVSRIFSEQEPSTEWAFDGQDRTAAELGFDDHLSARGVAGGPGFSPALESMQRSQRLEERRRAALEAGPSAAVEEPMEAELLESPYGSEGYPAENGYQAPYADDYRRPESDPFTAPYEPQQAAQDDSYGYQDGTGYGRDPYTPAERYQDDPFQPEQYPAPYAPAGHQDDSWTGGQQYGDEYQQPYAAGRFGEQQYDGEQYPEAQYADEYQQEYGYEEPAGHPYPAEELPALPPAAPAGGTTGAGLPQRRPGQQLAGAGGGQGTESPNWFTGAKDTSAPVEARGHDVSALGGYGPTGPTAAPSEWESPNDGDWQRAEKLREPSSAGTTPSGLPRRVPRQNLVPGNAKPTPQEGPQVSRDPNEVRGRLTNLRRGVEQGRQAGGDSGTTGTFRIDPDQGAYGDGPHNSSTDLFGGSNQQER
ncbi:nitrate- and nitrite sensing domain-containing protein [Kitasatospora cheerisanensis]|uniref:histidine kinase n=1 Tax=Kitasatospora cheerisanensis KCTC 2395 TaxID=1348663 RepID=A0A066YP42_9ACTN|nr:nitrate- and nitrite sensing domain-containing protein [Kitasatospora cheerisanensis]KDN83022.1 putative histidine kinase [Kitasatospora cheerisanensis KCTC 2395]